MGNDIFKMKEQSVIDRTLNDVVKNGNENDQKDKTFAYSEIEEKLLFKYFDFEHFIWELIKHFSEVKQNIVPGEEPKIPTMKTNEQLFLTKIDIPQMSSFFNGLLKTYKDKNREFSEYAINAFAKVIEAQIKERYLCNLTLLHLLAIPFMFCKGRPVEKLQYFHMFFKDDDTTKQMQITSYTRDLVFSCLCICTYGIRELKLKIKEQDNLKTKGNRTTTTATTNKNVNSTESTLTQEEKKGIYNEMKELCDMASLNETLSEIEYDLADSDIKNEEDVPGKKHILWDDLYKRYTSNQLKFSIFNSCLLRKYVHDNYNKIYNPTG